MSDYQINFADDAMAAAYEKVDADLQQQLDGHFDTLMSAPAMRKTPFPAHANRGVSITVETVDAKVVVHAARTKKSVEVLGLAVEVRSTEQRADYEAQNAVDCPMCKAAVGAPCRAPDGHRLTYAASNEYRALTHSARREYHQTGEVPEGIAAIESPRTNAFIIGDLLGGDANKHWTQTLNEYRAMFPDQETADGMIRGAMRVVIRHAPDRLWTRRNFWKFMSERVTGPHEDPNRVAVSTFTRRYGKSGMLRERYRTILRQGPAACAAHMGLAFAPHPQGGYVAVRHVKDLTWG